MKTMIRCGIGLAIALVAGAIGFVAGAQEGKPEKPVRTLKVNEVARVGERVITAEEFIQRVVERETMFQDPDLRTASAALDSLVIEEMLRSEQDRLEAWPKRRELDAEAAKLTDDVKAEFEKTNKALSRPYTWEEYLKYKYNLTPLEFDNRVKRIAKESVEHRLVVNYWILSTDSAEVEGMMMTDREKLLKIRTRLASGEKIGPIARANSEDTHTCSRDGAVGTVYVQDGSLRPEVDAALWKLKEGEWSDVIKAEDGYWVVRKAKDYPGNKAEFFDLREECLKRPNPDWAQMKQWRHALASSGRLTFERRVPGWDVQAGEK